MRAWIHASGQAFGMSCRSRNSLYTCMRAMTRTWRAESHPVVMSWTQVVACIHTLSTTMRALEVTTYRTMLAPSRICVICTACVCVYYVSMYVLVQVHVIQILVSVHAHVNRSIACTCKCGLTPLASWYASSEPYLYLACVHLHMHTLHIEGHTWAT